MHVSQVVFSLRSRSRPCFFKACLEQKQRKYFKSKFLVHFSWNASFADTSYEQLSSLLEEVCFPNRAFSCLHFTNDLKV